MTEPVIEATEAQIEEFSDKLSDEALDREGARACFGCIASHVACALLPCT